MHWPQFGICSNYKHISAGILPITSHNCMQFSRIWILHEINVTLLNLIVIAEFCAVVTHPLKLNEVHEHVNQSWVNKYPRLYNSYDVKTEKPCHYDNEYEQNTIMVVKLKRSKIWFLFGDIVLVSFNRNSHNILVLPLLRHLPVFTYSIEGARIHTFKCLMCLFIVNNHDD